MVTLRIGRTAEGTAFTLPLELVTLTAAIHGVRGRGKTHTAVVIVEELLKRGQQVVIIDPTDVWWGLKSSADGKGPGFPIVILGGFHGDLPLGGHAGAAVAEFAVRHRASMILSLRHLRKAAQRQFVTDFAEHLYQLKGSPEYRTPLFLAFDEASQWCPQRVGADQARMVGAIQDLVRLGRAAGLGAALIDQRPATVNKDVLTQLEVLVCHGVTSPQDRKALDEWIQAKGDTELRREFMSELPGLPRGVAYFWAPTLDVFERVQVRARETFDSSRTPRPGEAPPAPEKIAEVDLDTLRDQLRATIEEAEANDPRMLKKRIAELERELHSARKGASDPDAAERAIERALHEAESRHRAETRQLEDGFRAAQTSKARAAELLEQVARLVGQAVAVLRNGSTPPASSIPRGKAEAAERVAPAPKPRPTATPRSDLAPAIHVVEAGQISGRHRRVLDALARLESLGIRQVGRSVLGAFARYSPTSSGYEKTLSQLRVAGLIDYPASGDVTLTDAGRAIASPVQTPPTLHELHDAWRSILEPRFWRVLEPLIAAGRLSREELAERSGYSATSSGYEKTLGRLRAIGLVDYPEPGMVEATDLLFPAGLT